MLMQTPKWRRGLETEREEKDRFLAQHWQSPMPGGGCLLFTGLVYYSPGRAYRFEVEVHQHKGKETLMMEMGQGGPRRLHR